MTVLLFISGHLKKSLIKNCNVILKSRKANYAMKDGIMCFNQSKWKSISQSPNFMPVHVLYPGSC